MSNFRVSGISAGLCGLLMAVASAAHATSYTMTTTVTTDGVQSLAGGSRIIACRAPGSSTWTSCGATVASGTQVSIWAVANEGYWFMWFMTNPYLAGCTTTNWGWGYGPNPQTQCLFTMPAQNVNIGAEFQLP